MVVELRDLSSQRPPYRLDEAFYERVRASRDRHRKLDEFVVPAYSGRGFIVERGQTFRVVLVEGTQAGDVAFWNADDTKESFASLRTWEMEGYFLKAGTRLWSDVPWFRPMATCTEETVDSARRPDGWHHHLVGSHCSCEQWEMGSGWAGLNSCRVNFLQAIEPFGLKEEDLLDNIDVHTKWRLDPEDGSVHLAARNDGGPGDYIEFYAEMNLLVALSVCPIGGNTRPWSLPGDPPTPSLKIEIHDTGIEPKPFPQWTEWR